MIGPMSATSDINACGPPVDETDQEHARRQIAERPARQLQRHSGTTTGRSDVSRARSSTGAKGELVETQADAERRRALAPRLTDFLNQIVVKGLGGSGSARASGFGM